MNNRFTTLERNYKAATDYVLQLKRMRQIDIDENGEPCVLGIQEDPAESSLIRVYIKRNNRKENFLIKKRARKLDPIRTSFDINDGFEGDGSPRKAVEDTDDFKKERKFRVSDLEDYEKFIQQLIQDNK